MPVLHDTVASGASNTALASVTIAFTVGVNDARYLIVGVSQYEATGGGKYFTSMTYAGAAMTKLAEYSTGGFQCTSLWGLVAPATGNNNLVMSRTVGGDLYFDYGILSKYRVNQTAPVGAGSTSTGTGVAASLAVASNPGNLVVDNLMTMGGTARDPGASQTERWDLGPSGYSLTGNGSDCTAPAGASTTMTWTWTTSKFWAQAGVALCPLAAGQSVIWWF